MTDDFLNTQQLREIGAKYVFALMTNIMVGDTQNRMSRIPKYIIPKHTVGWTDMEIKDAPEAAVIPFYFLSGFEIIRANVQLVDLKLLEKL